MSVKPGILLALSALLALPAVSLAADAYPSRPVRLIVAYPPGGGVDTVARAIAPKLSDRLGKQVIIDNRGGAGGIIGTEIAAKSAPDGYTLLMVSGGHTTQPALQKVPYDLLKAFAPVARLATGATSLVVHPSVPANSIKELVALAKKPDSKLIFASVGIGTPQHLAAEFFKMKADIDFKITQFKGAGPAMIDVLGGHSQGFITVLVTTLPHIRAGKVKVLGTGGAERSAILPEVPTIAESGVPGYEYTQWYGIVAPAGTPAPIVDRLNNDVKALLALDEIKKWFLDSGAEVNHMPPAAFGAFMAREMATWDAVVKKANIKLE
jgi:tripartite-type tricarboxylate transporter receptor subunit TctC